MVDSRSKWTLREGRLLPAFLLLLALAPGRAAAELPRLSLPAMGLEGWQTSLLAGTDEVGIGTYLPFGCTKPVDGLALEVQQGFLRPGFSVDAAYRLVLTSGPSRIGKRGVNVATQLGLHVHSASRYRDDTGVGPALGFSVSRMTDRVPWDGSLEAFLGVQGATVMAPGGGRLDVPVRGSLGLQGWLTNVHLMLVARGGYDDVGSQWGARPTFDATCAVGVGLF